MNRISLPISVLKEEIKKCIAVGYNYNDYEILIGFLLQFVYNAEDISKEIYLKLLTESINLHDIFKIDDKSIGKITGLYATGFHYYTFDMKGNCIKNQKYYTKKNFFLSGMKIVEKHKTKLYMYQHLQLMTLKDM